jgi:two-component system, NarL family, sensor histidine kinase UhpB
MPNISRQTIGRSASEREQTVQSTEEHLAEELPQNESLYSKLVNSLGGIVWEADGKTFQFTFVSPQAEKILGYPVEQWLTEPNFWRVHTHPDDADWCAVFCLDATARRKDHEFKYRMIAADGRIVWLQDIVSVKVEADGSVRLRGIMIDITEHMQAEERLQWSEEQLRLLLDSTAEGIFGMDLEGRCTFCNAAGLRLLGYDHPSELLGRDMHALIAHTRADGTPYPKEECEVAQSLKNGASVFVDGDIFWRKDNTSFPAEYWSYPIFREDRHIGAVVTFLDITKRKLAEESLRLSEERFAKAFQASPEPISIYRHQDGVLLEVNERWVLVYGYAREEALGRTSLELGLFNPGDREQIRGLLERQRSVREIEVALKTKLGEIRHVSLSAEQIVINNELCDIFLHRDVTERKRAENENRQLIHQLGERVKELTAIHHAARILQDETKSESELLREIVALLPPAWQYPEITVGRIVFGGMEFKTADFTPTRWSQAAEFTAGGSQGVIEVYYLEERPPEHTGPFLLEERELLNSLAEMISSALNRRYGQKALRESEERFRQLTDNVREVLWLAEPGFKGVLYISPAYERIWGRTLTSLYQNPYSFLDAVHPDDRDHVEETIKRGLEQGFDHEYRVIRPDGTMSWVWERGFPIKDEKGRVYRVAGIVEDITERKEAEEQLKASSQRLRALSESIRRAKEEEGIRIARELHDELGSSLTSLRWSLLKLNKGFAGHGETAHKTAAQEEIDGMVALVDSTINTVRRISSEMRPGVLDDLGLVSAIEWHAQQFQEHTGIICRFDSFIENVELSREQGTTVFRIFQEAMTNILRHAQATKVNIIIEEEEGEFVLEIKDNGRGITESERLGIDSLGLLGMRERAHSINGKVEINGIPGKGTVLTVRLPINGAATP